MGYTLTRRAARDLLEIAYYTTLQWGEAQAISYEKQLRQSFEKLAAEPLIISSRPYGDAGHGCRLLLVNKHRVFYHVSKSGECRILRILHQSMLIMSERFQ